MILTPIALPDLPRALAAFDAVLDDAPLAQRAFRRIAASLSAVRDESLELSQAADHHAQAVEFIQRFGMGVLDESPTQGYTWDGQAVAVRMEPSVIIHEVGHLQTCAPERRAIPDFGLGAGPETGKRAQADDLMTVHGVAREMEEALASLQGILWEAELGQPAILAFLEQNWLEGGASAYNKAHFLKIFGQLYAHGLVDDEGRPTMALREADDAAFLGPVCGGV
jgi:hypothetical protein